MDFRDIVKSWQLWLTFFGVILLSSIVMAFRRQLKQGPEPAMTHPQEHILELGNRAPAGLHTMREDLNKLPEGSFELGVAPGSKGNATWIMHSYASTVKAGAELMAHEVSKYLQSVGWNVRVMLYDHTMESFDGVPLIKMPYQQPLDATCRRILEESDFILTQNFVAEDVLTIAEEFGLPTCFFLHLDVEKTEILQQRWNVPVFIIYNAITQHEVVPTIHPWTVVRPHINYEKFEGLNTSRGEHVTLLNCIPNKGGHVIKALADMMPDKKFLAVKGGYGPQVLDGDQPNLTYYNHTDNPLPFYENSRVVIMPSKSESWGRVALEAMAAGIPVVAGDTPGLRECTNGAAPICAQEDIGCWEREVGRLYDDGPDRTAAIAAGRRRIAELRKTNDYAAFDRFLIEKVKVAKAGAKLH
jgi:hypothetical protein